MSSFINKILSNICVDKRINNGIFEIEKNDHMEIFREYLKKYLKKDVDASVITEISNLVLEKGNFPERQAYNKETGILVTFPTPDYKVAAIKRGTHVEEDPMKKASNIFTTNPKEPEKKATPVVAPEKSKTEPKTNLPVSQATSPSVSDEEAPEQDIQVKTTAAPQQTPQSSTQASDIAKEPNELPPPAPKSDAEKEADKKAIKVMLKGDDYMLDEVVKYITYNAPPYIMEAIEKRLI